MQAVGMVNDRLVDCFRYREIQRLGFAVQSGFQLRYCRRSVSHGYTGSQ
jgi:hypothetical protein